MKNYYKILGVMDDAEDIVIRAAYKALAQRYHPDKWKGDQDSANRKMSDINEAYGVLSDKSKRATYDQEYHSNRQESAHNSRENKSNYKENRNGSEEAGWKQSENTENNYASLEKKKFSKSLIFFILIILGAFIFYYLRSIDSASQNSNQANNKKSYDFYAHEDPKNCQSNYEKEPRLSAEFTYNKETNKIFMKMDFYKSNERNLIFEMEQCGSIVNLDNWSCGGIESSDGISPVWKMTNGIFTYTEGYKKGSPILCNEKIVQRF